MTVRLPSFLVLSLVLLAASSARAVTNTWIGGTGSWETPSAWDLGHVPTGSEIAVLPSGPDYTVTLSSAASVLELQVGPGGQVGTAQTLTLASGGSLVASQQGVVGPSGVVLLEAGASLDGGLVVDGAIWSTGGALAGGTYTVAFLDIQDGLQVLGTTLVEIVGAANWLSGDVTLEGTLRILSGGSLQFDASASFLPGSSTTGKLDNQGTLLRTTAQGTAFVQTLFDSSGQVFHDSGGIDLSRASTITGLFQVGILATLSISPDQVVPGTSVLFDTGSTLDASGVTIVSTDAHLDVRGALDAELLLVFGRASYDGMAPGSLGTLDLQGGTFDGGGDLDVLYSFQWGGGALEGPGITRLVAGGAGTLAGPNAFFLRGGRKFVTDASVEWFDDASFTFDDGVLEIGGLGDFDIHGNGTMLSESPSTDLIRVFGLFGRAEAATTDGVNAVHVHVENQGASGSLTGTLHLTGGSEGVGTWGVDADATLRFASSTYVMDPPVGGGLGPVTPDVGEGMSVYSLGAVEFVDAVATVGGPYGSVFTSIIGSTVTFEAVADNLGGTVLGGEITGNGTYTEHSLLDWQSGVMSGNALTVLAPGATLVIQGASGQELGGNRGLQTHGPVHFEAGFHVELTGGTMANLATGDWMFEGNGQILCGVGCEPANDMVLNFGAWHHSAGAGTTFVEPPVENHGDILVSAGTLKFGSYLQSGAGSLLSLDDASVECVLPCVIEGGDVVGKGTFVGELKNVAGNVAPGFSEGKLTITSNYTQQSAGTMSMELGGAPPTGKFDQVEVQGTAALDGSMNVTTIGGYSPAPGDKFALVDAGTVQGNFSSVSAPTSPDGTQLAGKIEGNDFVLVAGVALRVGEGFTAGATATVPVSYLAGPACAQLMTGSIVLPASLSLSSVAGASGCTLTATPGGGGTLQLSASCPGGKSGTVQVGSLTFNVLDATVPRHALNPSGAAGVTDCGGSTTSLAASTQGGSVLLADLGDIFPSGVGDATVNLSDFIEARRKLLGINPSHPRDVIAGDLHPNTSPCSPAGQPAAVCPAGNDSFDLADSVIVRRMVLGIATLSCRPCALEPARPAESLGVPGDLAPRERPDGRLDVADVVAALRASVALEPLAGLESVRADVAPAVPARDGVLAPAGNGRVDVADVVLLLRATVGATRLEWPVRSLAVAADTAEPWTGVAARIDGWPAWAEIVRLESPACADDGLERDGALVGVACERSPDAEPDADVLRVTYASPRTVDPSSLALGGEAVDDALAPLPVSFRAEGR